MMLSRIAAMARARAGAAKPKVQPFAAVRFFSEGHAPKSGGSILKTTQGEAYGDQKTPQPLSMRMDGLMAQCLIAAVIYFAPQDIVFLIGLIVSWHNAASGSCPKKKYDDVDAAIEAFKTKKGIEHVTVSRQNVGSFAQGGTMYVKIE